MGDPVSGMLFSVQMLDGHYYVEERDQQGKWVVVAEVFVGNPDDDNSGDVKEEHWVYGKDLFPSEVKPDAKTLRFRWEELFERPSIAARNVKGRYAAYTVATCKKG